MNRSFVNDILHGRTISSFSSPTNKISIISLKHSTFWTDFAKPTGSVCWAAFTQKMSDGLLGSGKLTLIFGISSPVFQRLQLIFNYEPQDLKIPWQSLNCIPICLKPWPLQHHTLVQFWNTHPKSDDFRPAAIESVQIVQSGHPMARWKAKWLN